MSDTLRHAWAHRKCKPGDMVRVGFLEDSILVAPETVDAFRALETVLRAHGYRIRTNVTDTYNCRNIAGSNKASFHSYGIAIDINWDAGPFKRTPSKRKVIFSKGITQEDRLADVKRGRADTTFTPEMIADVKAIQTFNGARVWEWGGDWKSVKDAMHFEVRLTPDQLAAGIDPSTVCDDGSPPLPGTMDSLPSPADTSKFDRAHAFIKWAEGGFVDDPDDPGGATNHGVTIHTLSRYRGRQVSKAEVSALSKSEAETIMKALFWDEMNCDYLSGPLALAVYNAGIHCGTGIGERFLQMALNSLGAELDVDGEVGPLTLKAAELADSSRAVSGVLDLYEHRLRTRPTWWKYKNGWTRRAEKLREECRDWLEEDRQTAGKTKRKAKPGGSIMGAILSKIFGGGLFSRLFSGIGALLGLDKLGASTDMLNSSLTSGMGIKELLIIGGFILLSRQMEAMGIKLPKAEPTPKK